MTVRREVLRSASLSMLAAAAVIGGGLWAAGTVAREEAVREAQAATELLAAAVIGPALSDGIVTGDPKAVRALDKAVQGGILGDQILAVRVWAPSPDSPATGRIVYSDDLANLGAQFPLGAEEQEVLAGGEGHAELSDLAKAENAEQADFGELLEVYTRVNTPDGTPLLFETYQSTEAISATSGRVLRAFAPVILGGLLVFGAIQIALNARLARNLQGAQAERETLMRAAIEASEHERRSIAADLHDGVVQDLVGLTFQLEGLAVSSPSETGRAELAAAAGTTRRSVQGLRSLLVEIYPPNLQEIGLGAAIEDLVAPLRRAGMQVAVEIDAVGLGPEQEIAAYRMAREAVSNIARHSRATTASIRLQQLPSGDRELEIRDDGVGFDPGTVAEGHVGLVIARDLAKALGARLEVNSQAGSGTILTMVFPLTGVFPR